MQIVQRAFVVMTALVFLTGATAALAAQAQQPPAKQPPAAQQAPKASMAEGELLSVDTEAKTIAVKTAAGNEQFSYTDDTQVVGAQKTIAGLASAKGTRVRVHFTSEGTAKKATRIEVESAQ